MLCHWHVLVFLEARLGLQSRSQSFFRGLELEQDDCEREALGWFRSCFGGQVPANK